MTLGLVANTLGNDLSGNDTNRQRGRKKRHLTGDQVNKSKKEDVNSLRMCVSGCVG